MDLEKQRIIKVVDYDKTWKYKYDHEAKRLKRIFQSILIDIHHIGSTSIPGMAAKPTIDILVSVRRIEEVDSFNGAMKDAGYQVEGEYGIKGRRYFWKYPGNHEYHIHIFEKGDKNIIRYLAFKAYLIENKELIKEYMDLKRMLAVKYPKSIEDYMDGKNSLIKNIEHKALVWYAKKYQ